MKLRVLIACEFSGAVRDAFRRLKHEAWSCDLESIQPEGEWPNYHLFGDARDFLSEGWDLLIAHPPCTYLCNSGVRWLSDGKTLNAERHREMQTACNLFAAFYHASIPRVCVENPIMHKYARDYLQSAWKVPSFTQSIQPWQFGHGEVKRTCLWMRGLPDLKPAQIVSGRTARVHRASPGADRWKERSRTLPGIAQAMAEQWTALLK